MSDTIEHAKEGIEQAHHARAHEGYESARLIAVLVAALAAALAISDLGEKASTTAYLTRHIALSDDYAFYQEKHVRVTVLQTQEAVLMSLPAAAEPAVQARIKAVRSEQARLLDSPGSQGMKQLLEQAAQDKEARDHASHRAHHLEIVVGGLQIAIVLASVAVVTRVNALAWGGAALGVAVIAYGLLVWNGLA
jgi:hypothetical protein